ncbi:MAG: glycosyltransferase, partial [Pseudomonadota bacterium]
YYGVAAVDVARELGLPASVFFHGFELNSQLRDGYPTEPVPMRAGPALTGLRERTFYTVARDDRLLVNSQYTATLFDGFAEAAPIRTVGCGVAAAAMERLGYSPEQRARNRAAARRALGLSPTGPVLASVGRLVPTKRVDRMIDLVAADESFEAVIVGDGQCREALAHQIEAAGIADRVKLLGRAEEGDKWAAYEAADFTCLFSEPDLSTGQIEGFGITLLEGAVCGSLPVCSGTGGMGDVVSDRMTGLVLPARASDDDGGADRRAAAQRDAAMLRKIFDDGTGRDRMVAAAQAQIRSRFNWSAVSTRILSDDPGSDDPLPSGQSVECVALP